ncbi:uncharacterized protein LOC135815512 isoform X2 [Sycon ciliatum]|uniref:uncharacterized protein LOC135815512 isoform X2 n=1 Tax=Sycon ciliatum TaxID=27933 RepID=UPI0031F65EF9
MTTDHSSFADHHTAHSLAVQYEVRLKEDLARYPSKHGPSSERMQSCFQLIDDLLPKLGVYTPVLQSLRKELFDAVYSDEYTSTVLVRKPQVAADAQPAQPQLQRIPYFVLVNRLFDQRNEKAEALQDQLLKMTNTMRKKEDVINELEQEHSRTRNKMAELEERMHQMNNTILEQKDIISSLNATVKDHEQQEVDLQGEMRNRKHEYQTALHTASKEIKALHHFREGFEAANEAFAEAQPVTKRLRTAFATKQNQLLNNLAQARRLQQQLIEMQNMTIEEYDGFVEKNKQGLSKFVFDETDQEAPLNKALKAAQDRYKRGTMETSDELSLLAVQIEAVEKELKTMQEEQEKKKQQNSVLGLESSLPGNTSDGTAGAATAAHKEEQAESLIPNESLISKYGAMMYTSTNQGKTFAQMKDSRFCSSCGEKTVLCPHRCLEREHVVQLPLNCSHIMITRPGVKLLASKPEAPVDRLSGQSIGGFVLNKERSRPEYETIVQKVWEDYEKRVQQPRPIPRQLSLSRCLSIIEQFYSRVIWQDEYDVDEEIPVSILDMLYRYFKERYVIADIAYHGAFDFLQSVVTYSGEKRVVWLFGEQLAGTIDPACFRYLTLLCELLGILEWYTVTEYEQFAAIVYPFYTEDDIEQLTMGFASFVENRPTKDGAFEYTLYMLIKRIEPWVSEWESRLKLHPTREALWMSEIEFTECLEMQCPPGAENLRRRLFLETLVHMPGERDIVPCSRLAYIAAYLNILANAQTMTSELSKLKTARKGRNQSSSSTDPQKKRMAAMSAIKPPT